MLLRSSLVPVGVPSVRIRATGTVTDEVEPGAGIGDLRPGYIPRRGRTDGGHWEVPASVPSLRHSQLSLWSSELVESPTDCGQTDRATFASSRWSRSGSVASPQPGMGAVGGGEEKGAGDIGKSKSLPQLAAPWTP